MGDNTSNCTFVVNASSLMERPYCTAPEWVMICEAIFLAAVVVGSVAANSLVLLLIAKDRSLRYRSIMVCLSSVIADLLLVLVFHFPALISVSAQQWLFTDTGCIGIGFVAFYLIYVRWMAMAVISVDRFFYILYPLTYANWSKPFLIVLTINAWTMPFLLHLPSVFGYGGYSFRPGFSQCTIDCRDDTNCYELFVVNFSLQFSIGAVLPTALYLAMYIISRVKRRGRIILGSSLHPDMVENGFSGGNQNILSGHQDRPLQGHSFNFSKRDIQALITFLLVFVILILTNTPVYALVIMRRGFPVQYQEIPIWVHFVVVDLFYLSTILNPLLIMRNRDFRKAIVHMFEKKIKSIQANGGLRRSSIASILSTTAQRTQAVK